MLKVKIWVNAKGWKDGGYPNTLYFKNKSEVYEWLKVNPDVDIVSIEQVSLEEFAADYIG